MTDLQSLRHRLASLCLLVLCAFGLTAITGCQAETNDDGAQIELGDPD